MSSFVEIARRAKVEHDARLELARAHAAHERARQDQAFGKAMAALGADIVPALQRARLELATDDLDLVIEDNFETFPRPAAAEVSIKIVGPAIRAAHAGRVKPESVQAFFLHDGEGLSFGMGKRRGRVTDAMRPVLGEPIAVIEHAIAQVAASYFSDIEATMRAALAEPAGSVLSE